VVDVLESASTNRLHIGQTADIDDRLAHHNAGRGKYPGSGARWILLFTKLALTGWFEAVPLERSLKDIEVSCTIETMDRQTIRLAHPDLESGGSLVRIRPPRLSSKSVHALFLNRSRTGAFTSVTLRT